MKPVLRILLGIALVLAGFLTAAFFGLLLMIADCSIGCQERHEWLVPLALVILGLALMVVGVLLLIGRIFPSPARRGGQGRDSRNF
jgi:membrane protein implicated in regulation of membrane protease activity